jgi:hypothetical protein
LQAALAELAETGPGGPEAARVQDLFGAAGDIIGDELAISVAEATEIATNAASGTRN